jgi:hypothetical protein
VATGRAHEHRKFLQNQTGVEIDKGHKKVSARGKRLLSTVAST